MSDAEPEGLPPKCEEDGQSEAPWLGSVASVAPLLLAMTALGAALAFYLGWAYEKAYVEEWGLDFSAFSYNPYELMVASSTTLVWAVGTPLALVLLELLRPVFSLDTIFGSPAAASHRIHVVRSRPLLGALVLSGSLGAPALVVILSFVLGDLRTGLGTLWVVLLIMAGFSWQYARGGSSNARWILLSAVVFGVFFILVIAPAGLGRADAQHDKQHIDQLPRVELVLRRSLGLESEGLGGDELRTGPWRLVRANAGHLWLVSDAQEPTAVIQIDSSDIASITYIRDD